MRLIDADKLINQGYEIVVDGLQYDTCNKSIDIDNIPTSYDIDKVVAELEERQKEYLAGFGVHNNDEMYGVACGLGDAIKIVKHGCVSDDVCESGNQ